MIANETTIRQHSNDVDIKDKAIVSHHTALTNEKSNRIIK